MVTDRVMRKVAEVTAAGMVLVVGLGACAATSFGHAGRTRQPEPSHSQRTSPDLAALTRRAPCPPVKVRPATRAQLRAFQAVAAVTCDWGERTYPHAGRWTVLIRRASNTAVAALAAVFAQPDEPPTSGGCVDVLRSGVPLVLVDANGDYLVPRYPRDACGQAEEAISRAVQDHPWQTISVRKLKQQQTARALAAGCGMRAKDLVTIEGGALSPGGPVLTRHPDLPLHACLYRASPSSLDEGAFVRGVRLTADQSARLRDALTGAGTGVACVAQRLFAIISTPIYDSEGDAD